MEAKELTKQLFSIETVEDIKAFSDELSKAIESGALEPQEINNFKYLETRAIVLVGTRIIEPDFENMFSRMKKKYWEHNQMPKVAISDEHFESIRDKIKRDL